MSRRVSGLSVPTVASGALGRLGGAPLGAWGWGGWGEIEMALGRLGRCRITSWWIWLTHAAELCIDAAQGIEWMFLVFFPGSKRAKAACKRIRNVSSRFETYDLFTLVSFAFALYKKWKPLFQFLKLLGIEVTVFWYKKIYCKYEPCEFFKNAQGWVSNP